METNVLLEGKNFKYQIEKHPIIIETLRFPWHRLNSMGSSYFIKLWKTQSGLGEEVKMMHLK